MTQNLYVRIDKKTASTKASHKEGKVVAYSRLSNKIAVRYNAWTKDGKKYPARTLFYHILECDNSGILWIFKVVEQLRIYHGKSDHIDPDKMIIFKSRELEEGELNV